MKTTHQLTQHHEKLYHILSIISTAEHAIQFQKDLQANKNYSFYTREEIKAFVEKSNREIELHELAVQRLKNYYFKLCHTL